MLCVIWSLSVTDFPPDDISGGGIMESGGGRRNRRKSAITDWQNENVEEYTEDYDFHSNNLKFDKSAFYDEGNYGGSEGEFR